MPYFVDLETTGLDPLSDRILLFQMGTNARDIEIVDCAEETFPPAYRRSREDEKVLKVLQNAKFDIPFLKAQYGIRVRNVFDTMVAEQVLTAGLGYRVGLEALAWKYANVELDKSIRDEIMNFHYIGPRELEYARKDVEVLPIIWKEQSKQIEKDRLGETVLLENRLVPIVAEMEFRGVFIDRREWGKAIRYVEEKAVEYEDILYEEYCPEDCLCQTDFFGKKQGCMNWYSPDQSRKALRSLGIDLDSIDKDTLRRFLKRHPDNRIVWALRNYRKYTSLTTFNAPEHAHSRDGRVHAQFRQHGARTGRFSCREPNLQNIPRRIDKEVAAMFRAAFIASPGHTFIICDFSQIEMRIVAEIANEERMIEAFVEGRDLHLETARQIFQDQTIEHDDPRRDIAKNTNFCLQYGGGHDTLAGTARISVGDAKKIFAQYFQSYPRIQQWMSDTYEATKERGYALTLGKRRRYIPGLSDRGDTHKNVAINTPIQGTAADIAKRAMAELGKVLDDGAMVLFVHDEMVYEVPETGALEIQGIIRQKMIEAGEYYLKRIPIIVDIRIGDEWSKI